MRDVYFSTPNPTHTNLVSNQQDIVYIVALVFELCPAHTKQPPSSMLFFDFSGRDHFHTAIVRLQDLQWT